MVFFGYDIAIVQSTKLCWLSEKWVSYISIRLEPNIFLYYLKGSNIVYAYDRC